MVVKRKHLIATRVVNGPVEFFNDIEIVQTTAVVPVGGVATTAAVAVVGAAMVSVGMGGFSDRQWYLRRAGEGLVKVGRTNLVTQMMANFHDAPELVAVLESGKFYYRAMVQAVQSYNDYCTRPAADQSRTKYLKFWTTKHRPVGARWLAVPQVASNSCSCADFLLIKLPVFIVEHYENHLLGKRMCRQPLLHFTHGNGSCLLLWVTINAGADAGEDDTSNLCSSAKRRPLR